MPFEREVERAIAEALAGGRTDGPLAGHRPLPRLSPGRHAAAGGVLDNLVEDACFLAAADPVRLMRVLGEVGTDAGRERRRLYVQAVHRPRGRGPAERAMALEMCARQLGRDPDLRVDWGGLERRTQRASWRASDELLTLESHGAAVRAVAWGEVAGRQVVATASLDRTARLWDALSGEPLHTLKRHGGGMYGVALGRVVGQSLVATVSEDCTRRLWDAQSGEAVQCLKGHNGGVKAARRRGRQVTRGYRERGSNSADM